VMAKSNRKSIPDDIKRQVLIEAGYRCGVPTCRNILIARRKMHDELNTTEGINNFWADSTFRRICRIVRNVELGVVPIFFPYNHSSLRE
jgi:hypothetical protein